MASRNDAIHRAIETLQKLSDLVAERREEIARDAGLTVPQWRLLEEVATEHFMPSLFARRRAVSTTRIGWPASRVSSRVTSARWAEQDPPASSRPRSAAP